MGQNRPTLLDRARQTDPDGTPAHIAEILNESNMILQDAPAYPSNAQMGNRVTLRSSMPDVYWAGINEGYTKSKGSTRQVVDTIGILTGMSQVDSKMKLVLGDGAYMAHREKDDDAYVEKLGQTIANTILYGNENLLSNTFTGLAPRMASLATAKAGSQVHSHHSSPAGSDNTSFFVVDWGERAAKLIFPKDGMSGLQTTDKGEQMVTDADGLDMFAHVTKYDWSIGLSIEDPRRIARLANIDMSQALTDTSTLLVNSVIKLVNSMPAKMGNHRVLYTHEDIITALELQVINKPTGILLSMQEYLGEHILHFRGSPIRPLDQMSANEGTLT